MPGLGRIDGAEGRTDSDASRCLDGVDPAEWTELFYVPVQGRETDERYTPQWVFDGLGLTFDLDPASPVGGGDCVPADTRFTREDDGLSREWFGTVWLNPPFSNATPWARKFRQHGDGVFLGPIANSAWWTDLAGAADLLWMCRDFAFTHPEHAGKRSSMPLAFMAMGEPSTSALRRLATSGRHEGVLAVRAA